MKTAKKEHARIAAAKELLDRGYGKASQPLAGDPENPLMPFPDKVEIVIVDPKGQLGCRRATSGASHNAIPR